MNKNFYIIATAIIFGNIAVGADQAFKKRRLLQDPEVGALKNNFPLVNKEKPIKDEKQERKWRQEDLEKEQNAIRGWPLPKPDLTKFPFEQRGFHFNRPPRELTLFELAILNGYRPPMLPIISKAKGRETVQPPRRQGKPNGGRKRQRPWGLD